MLLTIVRFVAGLFLVQEPITVELFAPGVVSTGSYELTTSFSPNGNHATWSVSTPVYGRWLAILESERQNGKWSTPRVASFSGTWADADPMFTEDGSRLFFLSRRPLRGEQPESGYRIWYVNRQKNSWSNPQALPTVVNSMDMHYVSPVRDGSLFVASASAANGNQADIYRVPFANGAWSAPESLGSQINSPSHWDTTPYVAPDESYLIYASRGRPNSFGELDLYLSFRTEAGWSEPILLPAPINGSAREYCPIASADGKWLYFTSERGAFDSAGEARSDYGALRDQLTGPRNGLGDVYRTSLPVLLEWARGQSKQRLAR